MMMRAAERHGLPHGFPDTGIRVDEFRLAALGRHGMRARHDIKLEVSGRAQDEMIISAGR